MKLRRGLSIGKEPEPLVVPKPRPPAVVVRPDNEAFDEELQEWVTIPTATSVSEWHRSINGTTISFYPVAE